MASSRILGFPVLLRSERPLIMRTRQCLRIRAQTRNSDEGRSRGHIIDANMQVLKERMEEIRVKERLESCLAVEHGWNYILAGDHKQKQSELAKANKSLRDFSEIVAIVFATFGFTILSGTICLCLTSILVHFNQ